MYHSITDREAEVSHPYFQTNTKPEVFASQMQYLADNDYKVINLSEAVSLISGGSPQLLNQPIYSITSPRKYCVLTWDDGYRDFHDVAWPVLKKHGFTATMFLPTGFISNERKRLNGRDCLTWDEVVALAGEGAAFGAHTVSHVQLYELYKTAANQPDSSFPRRRESTYNNLSFLRRQESTNATLSFLRKQESIEKLTPIDYELRASKLQIEEKLGRPVEHYSYAYAFPEHDEKFVSFYDKSLREAGYQGAVTTRIGTVMPGDNTYCLKRIPVNSHDDTKLLQIKLEGGYDWLNRIQIMKKRLKFTG